MSEILKHSCTFELKFHKSNISNFQSLEVVDRSSETQLQVTENINFVNSSDG